LVIAEQSVERVKRVQRRSRLQAERVRQDSPETRISTTSQQTEVEKVREGWRLRKRAQRARKRSSVNGTARDAVDVRLKSEVDQ
jgi:hypothetical protein